MSNNEGDYMLSFNNELKCLNTPLYLKASYYCISYLATIMTEALQNV